MGMNVVYLSWEDSFISGHIYFFNKLRKESKFVLQKLQHSYVKVCFFVAIVINWSIFRIWPSWSERKVIMPLTDNFVFLLLFTRKLSVADFVFEVTLDGKSTNYFILWLLNKSLNNWRFLVFLRTFMSLVILRVLHFLTG